MAGITLTRARMDAERGLHALVEHFCYSRQGLHQVADEVYDAWQAGVAPRCHSCGLPKPYGGPCPKCGAQPKP